MQKDDYLSEYELIERVADEDIAEGRAAAADKLSPLKGDARADGADDRRADRHASTIDVTLIQRFALFTWTGLVGRHGFMAHMTTASKM